VTGISPNNGPIAGGTAVTITGSGFLPGATASIAGSPLVNVTVQSSTSIAGVTTTTLAVGSGDVVVSGSNGAGVLTGGFDYRLGLTQFGTPISLSGPSASDLVAGDFNGDGKVDLAYAARGAFVSVLLGDGTGAFPTVRTTTASGHDLFGLAAGDVNGDNHLDIVATDIDGSQVLVFHGDGTGNLSNTQTFASSGSYPESVLLADLEGNGSLDAVIAIFGSGGGTSPSVVQVLLADGAGGFQTPGTTWAVQNGPQRVAVTAKGMDTHLDIFSTNVQSQAISFLKGNGDGTFQTQVSIPVYYNSALGTGDFNGTGRPQVFVVFASSSPVLVWMDSTGSFQTTAVTTALAGHKNCVVVDLNRDGYPDVIAMATNGTQHSVFLNDRKGGFVEYLFTGPECGAGAASAGKLAAGDFDGDGRIDVAFASAHDNTVTVFLNK
jgi:hypothetical protein